MFPRAARYVTSGINRIIEPSLQQLLWQLIDLRLKQKSKMDYLQVFELSTHRFAGLTTQQIVHRQEQPPFKKVWQKDFVKRPVHGITVWVIDSGSYCTMLLPNKY